MTQKLKVSEKIALAAVIVAALGLLVPLLGLKKPEAPRNLESTKTATTVVNQPQFVAAPDEIKSVFNFIPVADNVIMTNTDAVFRVLRVSRHLRLLTALESGKDLAHVPHGTSFFVDGYYFSSYSVGRPESIKVNRFLPDFYTAFRVHALVDGEIVINGFTSASEAASLSVFDGGNNLSIILGSIPSSDQPRLVSIPYSRIKKLERRTIEQDSGQDSLVLDLIIR